MDSNKQNWVSSAGGWDGIAITAIAFLFVLIGSYIVANGRV